MKTSAPKASARVTSAAEGPAAASSSQAWNFFSRPDLHPPVVTWTTYTGCHSRADGYLFMGPHGQPVAQGTGRQPGLLIMERAGQPVWYFPPTGKLASNLAVQEYGGAPALTWFEGTPSLAGNVLVVSGTHTVADNSYKPVATIAAVGKGWLADEHELVLTPQGTALIAAHKLTTANLTPIGGPANGKVIDNAIQEIDIATGRLLFHWSGLRHIPVSETHVPVNKGGPTDLYHLNSVTLAPDGDIIVSSRHTWTAYKVSRKTGAIVWRLGGKNNDFALGRQVAFAWQHDVKMLGDRGLTIFDNEAYTTFGGGGISHVRSRSRAIILNIDEQAMCATFRHGYEHPSKLLVPDQGSTQALDGGRVLVGWGASPYISEFSQDGELLLNGSFPVYGGPTHEVVQSYRTLSYHWTGRPRGVPAAAVRPGKTGGAVVYASWNGATEVATWHVLAGKAASSLSAAGSGPHTGFETSVTVPDAGPYFAAVAADSAGREIGRSVPVKLT